MEKVFKMHEETSERLEKIRKSYNRVTIPLLKKDGEKWLSTVSH
jgi:hypothetical protein